jgi:hypothetical protein
MLGALGIRKTLELLTLQRRSTFVCEKLPKVLGLVSSVNVSHICFPPPSVSAVQEFWRQELCAQDMIGPCLSPFPYQNTIPRINHVHLIALQVCCHWTDQSKLHFPFPLQLVNANWREFVLFDVQKGRPGSMGLVYDAK